MVEVKMGGVYETALVKSGKSSLGDWKFIILKEDKGRKEISIWVRPINTHRGWRQLQGRKNNLSKILRTQRPAWGVAQHR